MDSTSSSIPLLFPPPHYSTWLIYYSIFELSPSDVVLAQMVECALSMREARGSIPLDYILFFHFFSTKKLLFVSLSCPARVSTITASIFHSPLDSYHFPFKNHSSPLPTIPHHSPHNPYIQQKFPITLQYPNLAQLVERVTVVNLWWSNIRMSVITRSGVRFS